MIASSTLLSPHFASYELGADNPAIGAGAQSNLYILAQWLEQARSVLGDRPIIVNQQPGQRRGFRTASQNLEVGGVNGSDHIAGLAADFSVSGLTTRQAFTILANAQLAGRLAPFDQLIFYWSDGHIHVSVNPRSRGEWREAIGGEYPFLTLERAVALLPILMFAVGAVLLIHYYA